MDPVTPIAVTPTTTSNGSDFKVTSVKKLTPKIIIPIIMVVIAIIIGSILYLQQNKSEKTLVSNNPREQFINNAINNGRFPSDSKIAQVGDETLYGRDLNYALAVHYPEQYQNPNTSNETLKKMGVQILATGSAVLQSAKQIDPNASVTPDTYNNTAKDLWARERLIQQLTAEYLSQELTYSGSLISVWYHNIRAPKIPIAQAQQLAKRKIDALHLRLKSKAITMEGAAEQIKSDTDLFEIDTNYRGNAYTKVVNATKTYQPFTYQQLNDAFFALKAGEVSPVIKIPANTAIGQADEEFYAVVSVNSITNTNNLSLDSWIKEQLNKYPVTIY